VPGYSRLANLVTKSGLADAEGALKDGNRTGPSDFGTAVSGLPALLPNDRLPTHTYQQDKLPHGITTPRWTHDSRSGLVVGGARGETRDGSLLEGVGTIVSGLLKPEQRHNPE
jgi:hypothetical protein